MRTLFFAGLIGLLPAFLAGEAIAREPLEISTDTPETFAEIEQEVNNTIPAYISDVQCGGWNLQESVQDKIANINGAPGRTHTWNGNIPSGMGTRENPDEQNAGYIFPDDTTGLVTACEQNTDQILKTDVWVPTRNPNRINEVKPYTGAYPHPYFEDPTCKWRVTGGNNTPNPAQPIALVGGNLQYGKTQATESPNTCRNFCSYLNNFQYEDCRDENIRVLTDPINGEEYFSCLSIQKRYICTDAWVEGTQEACDPATPPLPTISGEDPKNLTIWPNARSCQGADCRCEGAGCKNAPESTQTINRDEKPYQSYYRKYDALSARSRVPGVPNDQNVTNPQVACFGFYEEFDPKTQQTKEKDRRCVINIDVSDRINTQAGKGDYEQNLPDPLPGNRKRNPDFNKEEDLWFPNIGAGFSFINQDVLEENYHNNIAEALLTLDSTDKAAQQATRQTDDIDETKYDGYAESNQKRAFDDTGTGRTVVTWWQKQQNEVSELLHPPVVRLLMPSAWGLGIIDNKQNLIPDGVAISPDKRGERVEVQIDAEEDILDVALSFVEQSLLVQLEEEPIPIIIPLGSATEYRVQAEAWCTWVKQKNSTNTCANADPEIQDLMDTLYAYADETDRIRLLRAELSYYAENLLGLQKELTKPIRDWAKELVDNYSTIIAAQKAVTTAVEDEWKTAQETMDTFQAKTNQPWCMQQQFTAPIYSLLDPWLTMRIEDGNVTNNVADEYRLPNLSIDPVEDLIIDLSTITYIQKPLAIPVLKPMQIRLHIPQPPAISEEAEFDPLPPPPNSDAILNALRNTIEELPKLSKKSDTSAPPIELPAPINQAEIDATVATIREINSVLTNMNTAYQKFWHSIGPLNGQDDDEERTTNKQNLACTDWDDVTCQHVEMDLLERLMRIASRPGINLIEDYDTQGVAKNIGSVCAPEDHVCTPIHAEHTLPRQQWDIVGPTTEPTYIQNLRRDVRRLNLPEPIGGQDAEQYGPYQIDIQELLPVFDVPEAIDLTPTATP